MTTNKFLPIIFFITILFFLPGATTHADGPLPLSAYPRPKNDNGMGIHWNSNPYGQEDEVTDYFVAEVKAMGIKWVKFLSDQTEGRHQDYLVEQLVANDIMPVVRIYIACNDPFDLGSLGRMVDHYRPMGVYYYELYNEPDIPGKDGGWCDDPEPDAGYLASIWAPAAREIQAHGGYPSLPSIFPMGKNVAGWQDSFFQQFLRAVKDQGNTYVLYKSWGAVHNYMINHPPAYPRDPVNLTGAPLTTAEITHYHLDKNQVYAINQARLNQHEPGGYYVGDDSTQDVTGFLQFIAYHDQFVDLFGFEIPLISTEGGATVGSCEDPRYPCVDEQIQMDWTLESYTYMLDKAPTYYFTTCTWLLAQKAMDFFGGSVWETNAWYHDRKGAYIPVVDALKKYPRKGEPRRDQKTANNWLPPVIAPVATPVVRAVSPQTGAGGLTPGAAQFPNSLAAYPRPQNDNGRGVHYAPTILGQAPEVVDRFMGELTAMNIKWVKIMQGDIPKVEDQYLIEQLIAHNIEPIIRVYKPYNDPYQNLDALVEAARSLGVHYFELYNEPNIAGFPGGWRDGESVSVTRILDLWIPAADAVKKAGGLPGLPTLTPGGSYDDMRFLSEFLDGLQTRNRTDLLTGAWLPLHNYFLNHPLTYPDDPVNQKSQPLTQAEIEARALTPYHVDRINTARARELALPATQRKLTVYQDSNGFRKFEAYGKIFFDKFGFYIPIISTEGGAITGDDQDPRYFPVTTDDATTSTRQAYQAMLTDVPAYYFAFTPWLLANGAGSHWDAAWEDAAWYKVDGSTMPIVEVLKNDPTRLQPRNWQAQINRLESPLVAAWQAAHQPAPAAAGGSIANNGSVATTAATPPPALDSLAIKVIPITGGSSEFGTWQVAEANWKPSTTPYPRIYVYVYNADGSLSKRQQIKVTSNSGDILLMPGSNSGYTASMHITSFNQVYTISIAGGKGQAVQARGAEGYALHITFKPG